MQKHLCFQVRNGHDHYLAAFPVGKAFQETLLRFMEITKEIWHREGHLLNKNGVISGRLTFVVGDGVRLARKDIANRYIKDPEDGEFAIVPSDELDKAGDVPYVEYCTVEVTMQVCNGPIAYLSVVDHSTDDHEEYNSLVTIGEYHVRTMFMSEEEKTAAKEKYRAGLRRLTAATDCGDCE